MVTAAAKDVGGSPLLDPRLAPLLLFDNDGKASDGIGHARDDAGFFFYSIPTNQLLNTRVDTMRDHRYWATPQGWLLMAARGSPETFLWDPFTGGRIGLPLDREGFLRRGDGRRRCVLSRKPAVAAADDADCVVLVVDLADTALWHCRIGGADRRWLKHEFQPATFGAVVTHGAVRSAMSCLAAVEGRFVMKFGRSKIATLEFSPGPVFAVTPVDEDRAISPPVTCSSECLVESHGDLFCVRFRWPQTRTRIVAGIGVFKLDLSARAWVKAESLDGRVFLVHHCKFGASLDPQEDGLKGDCVYYCLQGDKALYVYNMERGTTALYDPGPCLQDHHSPTVFMTT
ncbi:hypothetical protein ACP70R_006506 [Stipagrostis hirtigluma subsp. patula]